MRWPLAVIWTALIVYFSFQAGSPNSPPPPFPHFDKVMHFTFYGVLALFWLRALKHHPEKAALILICVALLGLADEWHQGYVPYRDPSSLDWLADVCGALAALVIHRKLRKSADA
jgi:VanZ family protein